MLRTFAFGLVLIAALASAQSTHQVKTKQVHHKVKIKAKHHRKKVSKAERVRLKHVREYGPAHVYTP